MIINSRTTSHLSLADRATQYGDGCFSTISVKQNQLELLNTHIQRLKHDCNALGIKFEQWLALEQTLKAEASAISEGVLKVLISRGEGGRGYSPSGAMRAKAIISQHPWPLHYTQWQQHGIVVGLAKLALSQQAALAGIKHLNRLEQVLIKQELVQTKRDDLLVCDNQGYLIEASAANLFWLHNKKWFTPLLDKAGVCGVMRGHILHFMQKNSQPVEQISARPDALREAEAVFICNALMKLVPVKQLVLNDSQEPIAFDIDAVSQLQQQLAGSYV